MSGCCSRRLRSLRCTWRSSHARVSDVVLHFEVVELDAALELDQGEDVRGGDLCRIGVPQENRIDRPRVVGEESFEVEYLRVVFGRLHADVVERRRIAPVVLRGVGVGVEDVGRLVDLARDGGLVGEQVVEVAVDAEKGVPHLCLSGQVQHHLLPFGQIVAQRDGDLEHELLRFVVVEYPPPEGDVFIAFHIDHDQFAAALQRHPSDDRFVLCLPYLVVPALLFLLSFSHLGAVARFVTSLLRAG